MLDGGRFLLPVRHTSRNHSRHSGHVATAKATATMVAKIPDGHRPVAAVTPATNAAGKPGESFRSL